MTTYRIPALATVAAALVVVINGSGLTLDGPIKPQPGTPTTIERMLSAPVEVAIVVVGIAVLTMIAAWVHGGPKSLGGDDT